MKQKSNLIPKRKNQILRNLKLLFILVLVVIEIFGLNSIKAIIVQVVNLLLKNQNNKDIKSCRDKIRFFLQDCFVQTKN